ncbi:MAG: hypothetical protein L0Y66_07790 [Myxococcaceae bacterium]|nr:hypothetical protein [Myxococcaceae bacterium]MCI0672092.1 hypothetical protein [Myxococcaceae bacterium]
MPGTHPSPEFPCSFCGATAQTAVPLGRPASVACLDCATRLGRLLAHAPGELAGVWPVLAEVDDDTEPEPRVRDASGQVRELRDVTAELKKELTLEARAELAETYGDLEMYREQVQECGVILEVAKEPALVERALALLFSPHLCAPSAVEQLRLRLFLA